MKKLMKIGCGGIVGLFVLILAIGLIFGETETQNSSDANNSSNGEKNNKETVNKEVGIGEGLAVGKVLFQVNEIGEVNEIKAGNGFLKYTPDANGAVFLNVNVTVENKGTEMIQTDSSFFKLISSEGAQYSPSTILAADEKYFMFEGINPGLSLTGNVIFEVPPGLTGLILQVQTGHWGTETGKIKLN